jgi:hypothetical protein
LYLGLRPWVFIYLIGGKIFMAKKINHDLRYIAAVLAESWREGTLREKADWQFIINMEDKLLS